MAGDSALSSEADEKPVDKRKFLRWVQRKNPDRYDLLRSCAMRLSEAMEPFGFRWTEVTTDVGPALINEINFEKQLSPQRFSYVLIGLDNRGKLSFFVDFAVKDACEPFRWLRAGHMAREEDVASPKRRWGARWYHCNKKRRFIEDWEILVNSVPQIVDFLETGNEHRYIWKSKYVDDQL